MTNFKKIAEALQAHEDAVNSPKNLQRVAEYEERLQKLSARPLKRRQSW